MSNRYNPPNEVTNLRVTRGFYLDGVQVTATAAEINALDGLTADVDELNTLTGVTSSADELNILDGVTATAAEINKVAGLTAANASLTLTQEVTFTETSGGGTYTGTMALPAGSRIIDIGCDGQVLWNSAGACALIVGDGTDPDGFFTTTDLKATDLLAGEINNLEHPGGKAGVYIASEQRNLYSAAARDIIAVVTQASGTGTAGRTRVYVTYTVPVPVAATKA